MVRAYAYILAMGGDGLAEAARAAVLNARYVANGLKDTYDIPYPDCMHEVVLSARRQAAAGAGALDIAKRLIDYGYHPPTMYFPLIVKEALMIEPTETESRETLDGFIDAMKKISQEAKQTPQLLKDAPTGTPVQRLDETRAARNMILKYPY